MSIKEMATFLWLRVTSKMAVLNPEQKELSVSITKNLNVLLWKDMNIPHLKRS